MEDLERYKFLSEPWLTQRESEVLQLIALNKSDDEICHLLGIARRTVELHRSKIKRKLNIKRTADLVNFALQRGYGDPSVKDHKLLYDSFYGETMTTWSKMDAYIPYIKPSILRSIEFSPEHHEAGLTILSYFGKIVRQKYTGMKVKVNIEQEGLTVRMIIQTDEGNIEKIEKTLEEYGLVIKGEMPITEFISDPYQVLELKQQLRIAHMQIEHQKELLAITNKLYEDRIFNVEEQLRYLNSHIATGLKLLDNKDVILSSAINLIENKLDRGINKEDFLEIKEAMKKIKERNQSIFTKIADKINVLIIQGSISGVAGNFLTDLIKSLSKIS